MSKRLGLLVAALTSLACSGCATVRTADNARVGSPKVYGGTRLNAAALSGNEALLAQYRQFGIDAPSYPGVDLPLSFIGDTVMLPFSIWYTITEPIVGRQ